MIDLIKAMFRILVHQPWETIHNFHMKTLKTNLFLNPDLEIKYIQQLHK